MPILAGHVEYSESRCGHPQGGEVGPMRTKGDGEVNFGRYFAYVLYGWPLRPNVHNCYQWWL